MRSVGIKSLKDKLRDHLRLVASGETLLVTDRGRVVAELVPPRRPRPAALADSVLADAVLGDWNTELEGPQAELERDRDRCGC